jgi:uncharacterized membrane protein
MAALWLFTMILFLFLIVCIVFVIYALKSSINTEDSSLIDPMPRTDDNELENKK